MRWPFVGRPAGSSDAARIGNPNGGPPERRGRRPFAGTPRPGSGDLPDGRPHSAVPARYAVTAARTWVVDAANVTGSRPDGWWRDRPGAAARLHARILRLLTVPDAPNAGAGPTATAAPAREPATPNRPGPAGPAAPGGRQEAPDAERRTTRRAPLDGAPDRVVLVLEGAARSGVEAGTISTARPTLPMAPSGTAGPPPARALTVVHAPGSGDDAIVAAAAGAEPPVLVFTSDRALGARLTAIGAQVRGSGSLWALLDRL